MMNKENLIKGIHKILYVYEEEDYANYFACLSHQIIKLNSFECDVINDNVQLLTGLKNMGKDATHFDVRHTVLHVMNDFDRRIEQ
jgi:hypothetical protein